MASVILEARRLVENTCSKNPWYDSRRAQPCGPIEALVRATAGASRCLQARVARREAARVAEAEDAEARTRCRERRRDDVGVKRAPLPGLGSEPYRPKVMFVGWPAWAGHATLGSRH